MLQRPRDPPRPAPGARRRLGQGLDQGEGLFAARIGGIGQLAKQGAGGMTQGLGLGLRALRLRQAEREGKTAGRGRAEPGGPNEGVEFEDVKDVRRTRRRGETQTPRGQGGMGDQNGSGGEGPLGGAPADLARALVVADRPRARRHGERGRQDQPRLGAGHGRLGDDGFGRHPG
jgi:hypothetical protein